MRLSRVARVASTSCDRAGSNISRGKVWAHGEDNGFCAQAGAQVWPHYGNSVDKRVCAQPVQGARLGTEAWTSVARTSANRSGCGNKRWTTTASTAAAVANTRAHLLVFGFCFGSFAADLQHTVAFNVAQAWRYVSAKHCPTQKKQPLPKNKE